MCAAPAPVVEYISPAPAVSYAASTLQCVPHQLQWCSASLSTSGELHRVSFCSMCRTSSSGGVHLSGTSGELRYAASTPAVCAATTPVVECISPAPAVSYAASASAVCAAPAPMVEYISPSPALSYAASASAVCAAPAPMVEYYSTGNQFERFRGFLELISRFEFEFCRRENYFF